MSERLTFSDLPFPRALVLDRDWYDQKALKPARILVAGDSRFLWFAGEGSTDWDYNQQGQVGSFVSGLWKRDVLELFLSNPASGRYLELNLSPAGEWWGAIFSGPRELEGEWQPAEAKVFRHESDSLWRVALKLPNAAINAALAGEPTHANVTAITGTPKQQFLSLVNLGGGEPDFHRPAAFKTLEFS